MSRSNVQNSGLHDTFSINSDRHHQQWAGNYFSIFYYNL